MASKVVLILILLIGTARADTPVLPVGSRCYPIEHGEIQPVIEIAVPSLVVTVADVKEANAEHELLGRCVQSLSDCRADSKPESRWRSAGRWLAIGTAIGGAFVLGIWLGR